MFREAMNFGRSHLEKCWYRTDNGREGIISLYRPDQENPFAGSDIVTPYVNKEIFVLCLLTLEHTHEQWAIDFFDRSFSIAYETPFKWPYRGTLHQPRGMMFCLEIIDRILERSGRASEFLDKV